MATLFISDLHLEADRPDITEQFLAFLAGEARDAERLYILGDLFEVWLGDDDPTELPARVRTALRELVDAGTPCAFMHGNRDFLVGETFAGQTGCELLDEHTVVELYGERVLLMHGDLLCTDDVEYLRFRAMVRNPAWQQQMLALPFEQRVQLARGMREQTAEAAAGKDAQIMDVNQGAVEQTMREKGVSMLLHGHTHRPNVHTFALDDADATRIVLGDWYTQGSLVRWDNNGFTLDAMPRT